MMVTPVAYAHFIHMISSLAEGRVCAILEVSFISHCLQGEMMVTSVAYAHFIHMISSLA